VVLAVEDLPFISEVLPELPVREQLFFDPEWSG
jgi:hypothetical protein